MTVNQKIIRISVMILYLLQFSTLFIQKSFAETFDEADLNEVKPQLEGEVQGNEDSSTDSTTSTATETEPEYSIEPALEGGESQSTDRNSQSSDTILNHAIIDRVQFTIEPGTTPEEQIISCYFIFWNEHPAFIYKTNHREKKLIFDFNNTKIGSTPFSITSEPPINNFTIEEVEFDVNNTPKGLKPQWHDQLRIVFNLEAVPNIHVNSEDGIIFFTFKWTSDPSKQKKYISKKRSSKVMLWSSTGISGIALGALAYLFVRPQSDPPIVVDPLKKLPTTDLPTHPSIP